MVGWLLDVSLAFPTSAAVAASVAFLLWNLPEALAVQPPSKPGGVVGALRRAQETFPGCSRVQVWCGCYQSAAG